MSYNKSLFILLLSVSAIQVCAQAVVTKTKTKKVEQTVNGAITTTSPTVTMDLGLHAFGVLPFDVPFQIVGGSGTNDAVTMADLSGIDCWYALRTNADGVQLVVTPEVLATMTHTAWIKDGTSKQFAIRINPLKPNRDYDFVFRFRYGKVSDPTTVAKIQALAKAKLTQQIDNSINQYWGEISNPQLQQIIQNTENFIADSLAKDGTMIDFTAITPAIYAQLSGLAIKITQASGLVNRARTQLDKRIAFIQNKAQKDFQQFVASAGNADLQQLVRQFPNIYKYPKDANGLIPDSVTAYLKKMTDFQTQLQPLLPQNATLTNLKNSIKDRFGELTDDYNAYISTLKDRPTVVTTASQDFVKALSATLYQMAYLTGTTVPTDFKSRANLYVSADLGVAVIPELGAASPYLGTNIYLRPVNKAAPLAWRDFSWDQVGKRFSFLIGLSVNTLSKTGYRSDLLGNNLNLVTGAGFRVTDFIRLNAGALWYQQNNPNPLNSNKNIVSSFFASLSFDIDVKTIFTNLFSSTQLSSITPAANP